MDKHNFAIFYSIYLKSDYWRKLRSDKLDSIGNKCERCGTTKTLQVHHKTYYRNGEDILYHETLDDLECLCRACHEKEHGIKYTRIILKPTRGWNTNYHKKKKGRHKKKKKKPYFGMDKSSYYKRAQ
jgi:5-methylcytosine-specific restriction endonuclease McrA